VLQPVARPEAAFAACGDRLGIFLSEWSDAPELRVVLRDRAASQAVLAIGPEGGWTDDERDAALNAAFHEASLGRLILRTETAVTAALASLSYALGE
jgi:16S rRNA (uracil1498-N3)-methyltransferase